MVYFDIAAAVSLLEWRDPLSSSLTGVHIQKPVVFPASRRERCVFKRMRLENPALLHTFLHTHTKMMSDSGQVIVRPHLNKSWLHKH